MSKKVNKKIKKIIYSVINYNPEIRKVLLFFAVILIVYTGFVYVKAYYEIKVERLEYEMSSTKIDSNMSLQGLSLYIGTDEVYRFVSIPGGRIAVQDSLSNRIINVNSFLLGEIPVSSRLYNYVMKGDTISDNSNLEKYYDIAMGGLTKEEWMSFLEKINIKTGHIFRMPSIDEWIYAARGGRNNRNYIYAGSDSIDNVAIYKNTYNKELPLICRQKLPNDLGLYDMSGLVCELTSTSFTNYYSNKKALFDKLPKEVVFGNLCIGGWYNSKADDCAILKEPLIGAHTGTRLVLVE